MPGQPISQLGQEANFARSAGHYPRCMHRQMDRCCRCCWAVVDKRYRWVLSRLSCWQHRGATEKGTDKQV